MEKKIKISSEVSITIFDNPEIKEKTEELFSNNEEKIKKRIDEILTYLQLQDEKELSYDNIKAIFKIYFYKDIANKAVKMAFSEEDKYNVLSNSIFLLNEENFEKAIFGEPMVYAIRYLISKIPMDSNHGLGAVIRGSKMIALEQKFLGNNLFSNLK